jgi:hypothetical protein
MTLPISQCPSASNILFFKATERPSHTADEQARLSSNVEAVSREILETHPAPAQLDREVLARCIDECLTCLQSCVACADADLAEDDVARMRRCIRLCVDCADVCDATLRQLSRQTDYEASAARAQVAACRELCALCAEECERHAEHHEHCRICGESCRRCEEACSAVLDAIGGPS